VCDSCGWHGWRTSLASPARSSSQILPTKVDPPASNIVEAADRGGALELFESELPSWDPASVLPHQPESLRESVLIDATPRVGSRPAPRVRRALHRALRAVREQFVSGMRRHQLKRLQVSRPDMVRSSGFFALGLAAGALVFGNASQSASPGPSAEQASPMATSATTGTGTAEPLPSSRAGSPVALTGYISSVERQLKSSRAPKRERQAPAVRSGRTASRRLEGGSRSPSRSAAQLTEVVARPTTAGMSGQYRGSLAIDSHPSGARVSVDGRGIGSTPLVLRDVPAGSRLVRVEADGHQAWSWTARVVANQQTRVTAKLYRNPNR